MKNALKPTWILLLLLALVWSCGALAQTDSDAAATDEQTSEAAEPEMSTAEAEAGTLDEDTGLPTGVPAAPPMDAPEDTLALIRQRGVLQVGLSIYTPWAMTDSEGELIGFEVDVAQQLASDIGVEVNFNVDGWPDLLPDLLHGDFDVIISGMSITPQRALLVNFTQPYHYNETVLLANKEAAGDSASIDDFNQSGMIIGVWTGSVGAELAAVHFSDAEIRAFDDDAEMYQAVREGTVTAVVGSSPRPQLEMLQDPHDLVMPLEEALTMFGAGMAIRKGDADFLRFLDSWVQYHTLNRWLLERRAYWFESLDWVDRL